MILVGKVAMMCSYESSRVPIFTLRSVLISLQAYLTRPDDLSKLRDIHRPASSCRSNALVQARHHVLVVQAQRVALELVSGSEQAALHRPLRGLKVHCRAGQGVCV